MDLIVASYDMVCLHTNMYIRTHTRTCRGVVFGMDLIVASYGMEYIHTLYVLTHTHTHMYTYRGLILMMDLLVVSDAIAHIHAHTRTQRPDSRHGSDGSVRCHRNFVWSGGRCMFHVRIPILLFMHKLLLRRSRLDRMFHVRIPILLFMHKLLLRRSRSDCIVVCTNVYILPRA